MNEIPITPASSRGRPRAEGVDERILLVTLDLLGRVGYDAMSIAAVAAEAGVTKPTLYRRWESKEDLVTSAVSTLAAVGPEVSTGDIWEKLIGELEAFHDAIHRPNGMALIGNVLALEQRQPQLIELYRKKVVSVRRHRIRVVLDEALLQGAIRAEVDLEIVINLLIGYYYAACVSGESIDSQWPRLCVNQVRTGIEETGSTATAPMLAATESFPSRT